MLTDESSAKTLAHNGQDKQCVSQPKAQTLNPTKQMHQIFKWYTTKHDFFDSVP